MQTGAEASTSLVSKLRLSRVHRASDRRGCHGPSEPVLARTVSLDSARQAMKQQSSFSLVLSLRGFRSSSGTRAAQLREELQLEQEARQRAEVLVAELRKEVDELRTALGRSARSIRFEDEDTLSDGSRRQHRPRPLAPQLTLQKTLPPPLLTKQPSAGGSRRHLLRRSLTGTLLQAMPDVEPSQRLELLSARSSGGGASEVGGVRIALLREKATPLLQAVTNGHPLFTGLPVEGDAHAQLLLSFFPIDFEVGQSVLRQDTVGAWFAIVESGRFTAHQRAAAEGVVAAAQQQQTWQQPTQREPSFRKENRMARLSKHRLKRGRLAGEKPLVLQAVEDTVSAMATVTGSWVSGNGGGGGQKPSASPEDGGDASAFPEDSHQSPQQRLPDAQRLPAPAEARAVGAGVQLGELEVAPSPLLDGPALARWDAAAATAAAANARAAATAAAGAAAVAAARPPTRPPARPSSGAPSRLSEPGEHEIVTRSYGPGDSFGELSLLYDCPCTETVRCCTAGRLWVLERSAFSALMRVVGEEFLSSAPTSQFFRTIECLAALGLTDAQQHALAEASEERSYALPSSSSLGLAPPHPPLASPLLTLPWPRPSLNLPWHTLGPSSPSSPSWPSPSSPSLTLFARYAPGQPIFTECDAPDAVFCVMAGQAKARKDGALRKEFHRGEFFGVQVRTPLSSL